MAGIRTPMPIGQMEQKIARSVRSSSWKSCKRWRSHYHDMQDMEFTVEHGKLYMLQTRNGKRTAAAATARSPCDLMDEGMISRRRSAACMIDAKQLDTLLHPQFDPERAEGRQRPWQRPGRFPGRSLRARSCSPPRTRWSRASRGEKVHPGARWRLSPEDIEGMKYCQGISDRSRRTDLPRGRRGARHGYLLRGRAAAKL